MILPHITKQLLYASPIDFEHLLKYKSIKLQDFVNPEFAEKATKILLGCCAVILSRGSYNVLFWKIVKQYGLSISVSLVCFSSGSSRETPIAIGCWRGRTSISVMVNAIDSQELLERVSTLRQEDSSIPEEAGEDETMKVSESTPPKLD